ncbi:hypothetical protein FF38_00377 [Lucilia cuprina]|uniref:TEP1-F n=1 Tax=Lucilia cuprina TaxID=7375 RepID=A0A0L0BSF6_LUCCU|nr:hypothetical protein FF38_00377 [Lucilia cuprina]
MKRTLSSVLIFLQILIFVNARGSYHNEEEDQTILHILCYCPAFTESREYHFGARFFKPIPESSFMPDKKGSGMKEISGISLKNIKLISSFYSIVAPGTIQSHLDYSVSVTLHENSEPATIKAVYKPGDLVQYRIVVLDENTRPAKLEQPLTLGFKDGAGNFVKQIKDIQLTKGVYTGEFQLSDQPVLGEWIMEVNLSPNEDDTKTEKKFHVDKYVLPKFSVDIETAKDISYDLPLKITIRSKYTYGKPVKGQATIAIDAQYGKLKTEKTIEVDGKGHVEFDLRKDLGLEKPNFNSGYGNYSTTPPINIFATMTEEYTGNKQNKTASVNLHRSRYVIEVPEKVYDYVANKTFELKAFVKNLDGSPVQDGKHMAKLSIGKDSMFYNEKEDSVECVYTSELDKNGMVLFKVTLPKVDYYYNVRLIYADRTKYLSGLMGRTKDKKEIRYGEEDVGPLKLVKKTEIFQLDQDVVVDVKSNQNIPYYVYAVVARGNIVKQEYVNVPENSKSHEIKFKPTFEMVPESHLYVYFVLEGDLKFKEMRLNFHKEFQNKIEITAPKQVKPGEEVKLNIKTDPESFVGLLGIDQSVLLLKSGNDLDSEKIINDLNSYVTSTPDIKGYGTYPGRSSGLITQTNANYPYSLYITDLDIEELLENRFGSSNDIKETETDSVLNLITREDFSDIWIYKVINSLLQMDVCTEFIPGANIDLKESNMAIMEIYLPSGFTADTDKFDTIYQIKQVQRVETKNSDTAIIIYFDYLTAGEVVCFNVNAEKAHAVAKQKPAAITMYDYYNADQRATVYYEVKSSLCDICEEVMRRTLSSVLIFLQILIFVNARGFYSIVAPGTIQSHLDYSVSVTLHENSEPATIKVGIKGPSYNEEKTVEISPSHTEVVNFEIPNLKSGKYQLESEDLGLENPDFNDYYYFGTPAINIFAVVTEEYTGNKQNKTASVNLHRSRYIIEVPEIVDDYVVNKPFEMKAFVKNLDGSPVQDGKHMAKLSIGRDRHLYEEEDEAIKYVYTSELDKNGMVLFKVTLPMVDYYYDVRLIYADRTKYLSGLLGRITDNIEIKYGEENVGPIKLVKKTEKFQLDQDVVVDVKSNQNIPYYVYAVVARGNIIKQEYVKVPENSKSHEIKFKPTFEMVPESHLYVYFVLNGDLKFHEITLNFSKEFQNKIEITAPKQVKPGEEVKLNIKTDPESFVGLLGIDQSVLLLKTGNDLDSEKIINDLNSYATSTPDIKGYGTYPGISSGLITQTNANYPYVQCKFCITLVFLDF